MKKAIYAIICIFLIISTPISASAYNILSPEDDPRNIGEAMIINVDHVEPTIIRSDYFKDNDFEAYVFLKGATLGTFLFGNDAPETSPFFGDLRIKNIRLTTDPESARYISGLSQIKAPAGKELVVDSTGNVDLGYTKIRFKKSPVEANIPDTINIEVTAQIYFDVTTGFGDLGVFSLNLVPESNRDNWLSNGYTSGEIWGGRGYLRLVSLQGNIGKFELYDGQKRLVKSFQLTAGSPGEQITLPGGTNYLENQMVVKFDTINTASEKASFIIDNNGKIDYDKTLVKGMRVAPGSKWSIADIYKDSILFIDDDGNQKTLNYVTTQRTSIADQILNLIKRQFSSSVTQPPNTNEIQINLNAAREIVQAASQILNTNNIQTPGIQNSPALDEENFLPSSGWLAILDASNWWSSDKIRLNYNNGWIYTPLGTGDSKGKTIITGKTSCDYLKEKDYDNAVYNVCLSLTGKDFASGLFIILDFLKGDNKLTLNFGTNGRVQLVEFTASSTESEVLDALEKNTQGTNPLRESITKINSLRDDEDLAKLQGPTIEGYYTSPGDIFGVSTDLYFRHIGNGNWEWSPDKENWMSTSTTTVSGGEYNGISPREYNIRIISKLNTIKPLPPEASILQAMQQITTTTDGSNNQLQTRESVAYYQKAIREYENALITAPTNFSLIYESYLGMARVYEKMNDLPNALRYYQKAEEYSSYNLGTTFDFDKKYKSLLEGIVNGYQTLNLGDGLSVTLLTIETGKNTEPSFIYTINDYEKPQLKVNEILDLGIDPVDENGNKYDWKVLSIGTDSVIIRQQFKDSNVQRRYEEQSITLKLDQNTPVPYDGRNTKIVLIKKIDLTKSAIITITPGSKDNYGTSYFTITLPIDKRLIQLTPDQIDSQIRATDKALNKLDGIINRLSSIVKTWKGLCFAVFAFLTVKNAFFTNPTGRRLAVQRMQSDCQQGIDAGNYDYKNLDDCMSQRKDELDSWIETSKSAVKETEDVFDGFSWEDRAKVERVAAEIEGVSADDLIAMQKYGYLNAEDLRDTVYAKKAGWQESEASILQIQQNREKAKTITDALKAQDPKTPREEQILIRELRSSQETNIVTTTSIATHLQDQDSRVTQYFNSNPTYAGKNVVQDLPIYESPEGEHYVWRGSQRVIVSPITPPGSTTSLRSSMGDYFEDTNHNVYLSSRLSEGYSRDYKGYTGGIPEVYYDSTNKNRPTYIPFRSATEVTEIPKLNYANYIEVYVDNNNKYHYTIINVGANGKLDIGSDGYASQDSDDVVVVHSSLLDPENPTSRSGPYASLMQKIQSSYRDANTNVKANSDVRINGLTYPVNLLERKSTSSMTQCTQIMPETDCKILFGVCDPVMCPVSRFNFGGAWKVSNVVEKGIIGSIVLGLPNFNIPYEPVPVCLTGINAGLENIYSMLGSYRDCLETAKVTGESVGICNEIRSLYMCDILWKEALALVDVFGELRKIIATNIFGSKAKGEIDLSFQNSWSQMTDSFNFFTKEYAQTAFAAFQSRSTDQIGTEICKAAIFGQYPGGGDLLAQLTEPESPPQFTGWFEEEVYTSVDQESLANLGQASYATGQSAYRVYYHIYAGRNNDVRYQVYLVDDLGNRIPATDERGGTLGGTRYLKKGESVDKSFVLTGKIPGFNKMCIEINGRIECGFGSVSSQFSLQYLKDQLIKNEISEQITTQEQCLPSNSYYTPGFVQSGVRRVCSVYDPDGVGDGYVYVGTCGYDSNERFLGDCYLYAKDIKLYDLNYSVTDTVSKKIIDDRQNFTQSDIKLANEDIAKLQTESQSAMTAQSKEKIIAEYRALIESNINEDITAKSYNEIAKIYESLADAAVIPEVFELLQKLNVIPKIVTNLQDLPQLMRYLNDNSISVNSRSCLCGDSCEEYASYILSNSQAYNVDPILILALMMQESSCKYDLTSSAGAIGLMQLMPKTANDVCGLPENYLSGKQNIANNIGCGINVLVNKYQTYSNGLSEDALKNLCTDSNIRNKYANYRGWEAALRGYNGWGCNPSTAAINYVEEVVSRYNELNQQISRVASLTIEPVQNITEEMIVLNKLGDITPGGIYIYNPGGAGVTDLYYRYLEDEDRWEWSPDKINWMPTSTTIVNGGAYNGQTPVQENVDLIASLEKLKPSPNQAEEIIANFPVQGCDKVSEEATCDSYTGCYFKKTKGLFGADWLSKDSCSDCRQLTSCQDISNKAKCDSTICPALRGFSCSWDISKNICKTNN